MDIAEAANTEDAKNEFLLKYINLPTEVFLNKKLDKICCILFALIHLHDDPKKHCFASNSYFAALLDVSTTTISTSISTLIEEGYIERISFDGRKRKIKISDNWAEKHKNKTEELYDRKADFKLDLSQPLNDFKSSYKESLTYNNIINNKENNIFPLSKDKGMECDALQPEPVKTGIKIIRDKNILKKRPLSEIEIENLNDYSKRAKQLLLYWNNIGKPIPSHAIQNFLSKTCKHSLEALDHIINQGYSDDVIQQSFQNYKKLLEMDNCKLYQDSMAVKNSLSEFLRPTSITKDKFIESGLNIESWFKECLFSWEQIEQKYTKEAKNPYPTITENLKEAWKKESPYKKFMIDDENIFRKTAEKAYNYFINLKDFKCVSGCNNKHPASCVGLIIEVLKKEGHNFDIVPYWIQSDNFFRNGLDPYLKEMNYIIEGYDAYCNEQDEERIRRIKRKEEQDERDRKEAALSDID